MTLPRTVLPRTVGEVLADHVRFEVECIDRMYLNVYVPQLQYATGLVRYIHRQLGKPVASTAALAPVSEGFTRAVRAFAASRQIPLGGLRQGPAQGRRGARVPGPVHRDRGSAVHRPRAGEGLAVPDPQAPPGRRQLLPVDRRGDRRGQPVLLLLRG